MSKNSYFAEEFAYNIRTMFANTEPRIGWFFCVFICLVMDNICVSPVVICRKINNNNIQQQQQLEQQQQQLLVYINSTFPLKIKALHSIYSGIGFTFNSLLMVHFSTPFEERRTTKNNNNNTLSVHLMDDIGIYMTLFLQDGSCINPLQNNLEKNEYRRISILYSAF